MHALRELRRTAGLSQQECADLIATPLNTFRMWDSGQRPVPVPMLRRAREALEYRAHQNELLPLDRLASELGVHVRTLQAAARTGRLEVRFSTRSVFGRPMRLTTRAAGEHFKRTHYRRFAGQTVCAHRSQPCPPTTTSSSSVFVVACDLPRKASRTISAPPERPSSISGSRGRGRPHRCSGNGSKSSIRSHEQRQTLAPVRPLVANPLATYED